MSGEVRVALLGLGTVGSAVVRLAVATAPRLRARGAAVVVDAALVRDRSRVRDVSSYVPFVTDSADAVFAREHDVIVEALGGIDPAAGFVARALERGTPVVTANKSLIAAHGDRLTALARARGTRLRFEASVVAGVPFLHALSSRPLAAEVSGVEAILNGTSNFILTCMAEDGCSFDTALARAQALGYAEPDPANDVSGRDAAEKLAVLVRELGVGRVSPGDIETAPLTSVGRADLDEARVRGGSIKPIARARRTSRGIEALVGPAFLPGSHPLARVHGVLNGVLLHSRYAGPLFYSGHGAGPDVTAATILDDVVAVATAGDLRRRSAGRQRCHTFRA